MTVKLRVGDKAPDFDLELAGGGRVSLADLSGESALIWFYPAANTPLCTKQACALRDRYSELHANGAQILGISPDVIEDVEKFKNQQKLPFMMAADPSRSTLMAYGAWGEKNMYGKITEGVIRSSFILNSSGMITAVKYRVGTPSHVDFVRNALGLRTDE